MIPQTDAEGRVYVTVGGTPVFWVDGLGYAANGSLCVTTAVAAEDVFCDGFRTTNTGVVVRAAQAGTPFSVGGYPFNPTDGALASQIDVAPGVNDPFVAGIRVSPTGGVYMTSAIPP